MSAYVTTPISPYLTTPSRAPKNLLKGFRTLSRQPRAATAFSGRPAWCEPFLARLPRALSCQPQNGGAAPDARRGLGGPRRWCDARARLSDVGALAPCRPPARSLASAGPAPQSGYVGRVPGAPPDGRVSSRRTRRGRSAGRLRGVNQFTVALRRNAAAHCAW
jgi:hypothetical protein